MSKSNLIPLAGVIPVNKPAGPTSHDMVAQVRKLLSPKRGVKVGHTGTLDPFATGLLPIAFGNATRLIEYAKDWPKTYLLTIKLGATSDTDDSTGQIHKFLPLNEGESEGVSSSLPLTKEELEGVLRQFTGTIKQIPPIYSAKKIKGQRLYQIARGSPKASEIQKLAGDKTSTVTIYDIKLISYKTNDVGEPLSGLPELVLEVTCGPGTYMRSLARDIGEILGVGAYAAELQRIKTGPIDINNSIQPDKINSANLSQFVLSPEILIQHLPRLTLSEVNVAKLKNGQTVEWGNTPASETMPKISPSQPLAAFDTQKRLQAIVELDPATPLLRPLKVLIN